MVSLGAISALFLRCLPSVCLGNTPRHFLGTSWTGKFSAKALVPRTTPSKTSQPIAWQTAFARSSQDSRYPRHFLANFPSSFPENALFPGVFLPTFPKCFSGTREIQRFPRHMPSKTLPRRFQEHYPVPRHIDGNLSQEIPW